VARKTRRFLAVDPPQRYTWDELGIRSGIQDRIRDAVDTVAHGYDYTRHLVRGNKIRGDLSRPREGLPPVVLVHGFLGTRGTMLPLTRRFQAGGRVVFSYHYGMFNTGSIRGSSQALLRDLRKIVDELDVPEVDMVGFSMGGLISLHALKFLQAHLYVRRMVTLGTPVDGTWVGLAGIAALGAISPSVWQLLPGSKFIEELRSAPMPPSVRMRQIHASNDAFVPPTPPMEDVARDDYLILPGGHSSLVVAPHFYDAVVDFFDRKEEIPPRELEAAIASAGLKPGLRLLAGGVS
jgi:pimeloyl-ACP methyl ester carboxylesterase